jgi:hypothetical protein|nr:hypothetical protein [uncultured bacterium]|tara:strand:+ start:2593 stop:3039 length:447 start_codon:yes stop_codon:yes gene_type:complete
MKHTIFIILAVTVCISCSDASSKIKNAEDRMSIEGVTDILKNNELPVFSFEEEVWDFGPIKDGDVVDHDFEFMNTGESPLIISSAQGSCGCTVPKYSNEPIAPGSKGIISVQFNSKGKGGSQEKTVTLSANTVPNTKVLKIKAQVALQ